MRLLKDTEERLAIEAYIVANGDADDVANFKKFATLAPTGFFKGMTVESFMDWAQDNFAAKLTELETAAASRRIAGAYGVPSENDLEDALSWAECAAFQGSKEQVKWARDIASKNVAAIALAQKQGKPVPTSAKWWIENRNNIVVSLPNA